VSSALASHPLDRWVDPAALFLGGPARAEHAFWLDAGPRATDGWSWLGIGTPVPSAPRDAVAGDGGTGRGDAPVPGPFRGGAVGWYGYDAGAALAGAPAVVDHSPPPELWLQVDRFVAIDHAAGRLWAIAPADDLDAFRAEVQGWAHSGVAAATASPPASRAAVPAPSRSATGRHTAGEYAALIERCRDAIRAGDAYQLCLTTRFEVTASGDEIDPVEVYLDLRAHQPAHHGGLIRSGQVALASASPEQFLRIADGIVRTRPIKGTRPRSADADEDSALADDLRASQKERAENVMIVDLMRNDLQRVCAAGSVAAERLLEVESYPAVHQLVSTVAGRLLPGTTIGDVLDATFPAGSMTGAPKLSAMTILRELEAAPRGVYSGCFGWVGSDGSADLAMVIRSVLIRPGGAYVGAGGGITWLSDPAAEVAEVGVKARGPLAALGASLPPGW